MLTEADKETRRLRVGGSEVGAILGLSPYGTGFDCFARLTMGVEREPSPELIAGQYLERGLLDWYIDNADDVKQTVAASSRVHPRLDWLSATPDLVVLDDAGALAWLADAKTERDRNAWGTPGTDQVPAYLAAQFQTQMACWDVDRVDVPVYFKVSDEFAVFRVKRDDAVIDAILTTVGAWYERHIVRGEMPSLDGSSAASAYLKKRYPGGSGFMPEANADQAALIREYVAAKAHESAARDASEVLRQRVIFEIKDNDGFTLADSGRVTFRADKRGQRSLRLSGFKGSDE